VENATSVKQRQSAGKVLVLGDDTRSFLAVVRSLGRHNLQVHVAWCPHDFAAVHSKYIFKVHDISPYAVTNDSWKYSLISILQRENFDLVIPCNDRTIIPLQTHRADLEHINPIYLLNEKSYEVAFDKFKTTELARSLGIPVPREMLVSNQPIEAEAVLSKFQLPVVFKPRTSFNRQDVVNRRNVMKIYNPEELSICLNSMRSQDTVIIQENFIGTGVGVEILAEKGQVLFAFQHIRVHEPLMGGASSYRKGVPVQAELLDATKKLMQALNYTGVAMVEFKVNFKTGEWVLLEINARFWGSLPLAVAAGADFPYYLYQLLLEGKREFPQNYQTGIYCRNLLDDLRWLRHNIRANRLDPTLATLPLYQVIKEVINILTLRERSDTFVMDDPKPGFIELAHFIHRLTAIAARRIMLSPLSLPPVRKLYVRKTQHALNKAKMVLFVCKGNICRSPFAECYARAKDIFQDSIKVTSTGYHPEEGRVCPKNAVDAARAIGIDLNGHRSTIINEELMRKAHIIFTFDEADRIVLSKRYPFAKSKLHRLSLLAQHGPIIIKDPWGGSINEFKSVFNTIAQALDSYVYASTIKARRQWLRRNRYCLG
jgi:protein-tyrosine-phosphatase/predicted ATP-grasp superfamily ATP-dependent carboligase